MNTKQKIEVMQAFLRGEEIEVRAASEIRPGPWHRLRDDPDRANGEEPIWNFLHWDFRVKPAPEEQKVF